MPVDIGLDGVQKGLLFVLSVRRILRYLKQGVDPPPLAPARLEQGRFAWTSVQSPHGDRVVGPQSGRRYRCAHSTLHQRFPHDPDDFERLRGAEGTFLSPSEVDENVAPSLRMRENVFWISYSFRCLGVSFLIHFPYATH